MVQTVDERVNAIHELILANKLEDPLYFMYYFKDEGSLAFYRKIPTFAPVLLGDLVRKVDKRYSQSERFFMQHIKKVRNYKAGHVRKDYPVIEKELAALLEDAYKIFLDTGQNFDHIEMSFAEAIAIAYRDGNFNLIGLPERFKNFLSIDIDADEKKEDVLDEDEITLEHAVEFVEHIRTKNASLFKQDFSKDRSKLPNGIKPNPTLARIRDVQDFTPDAYFKQESDSFLRGRMFEGEGLIGSVLSHEEADKIKKCLFGKSFESFINIVAELNEERTRRNEQPLPARIFVYGALLNGMRGGFERNQAIPLLALMRNIDRIQEFEKLQYDEKWVKLRDRAIAQGQRDLANLAEGSDLREFAKEVLNPSLVSANDSILARLNSLEVREGYIYSPAPDVPDGAMEMKDEKLDFTQDLVELNYLATGNIQEIIQSQSIILGEGNYKIKAEEIEEIKNLANVLITEVNYQAIGLLAEEIIGLENDLGSKSELDLKEILVVLENIKSENVNLAETAMRELGLSESLILRLAQNQELDDIYPAVDYLKSAVKANLAKNKISKISFNHEGHLVGEIADVKFDVGLVLENLEKIINSDFGNVEHLGIQEYLTEINHDHFQIIISDAGNKKQEILDVQAQANAGVVLIAEELRSYKEHERDDYISENIDDSITILKSIQQPSTALQLRTQKDILVSFGVNGKSLDQLIESTNVEAINIAITDKIAELESYKFAHKILHSLQTINVDSLSFNRLDLEDEKEFEAQIDEQDQFDQFVLSHLTTLARGGANEINAVAFLNNDKLQGCLQAEYKHDEIFWGEAVSKFSIICEKLDSSQLAVGVIVNEVKRISHAAKESNDSSEISRVSKLLADILDEQSADAIVKFGVDKSIVDRLIKSEDISNVYKAVRKIIKTLNEELSSLAVAELTHNIAEMKEERDIEKINQQISLLKDFSCFSEFKTTQQFAGVGKNKAGAGDIFEQLDIMSKDEFNKLAGGLNKRQNMQDFFDAVTHKITSLEGVRDSLLRDEQMERKAAEDVSSNAANVISGIIEDYNFEPLSVLYNPEEAEVKFDEANSVLTKEQAIILRDELKSMKKSNLDAMRDYSEAELTVGSLDAEKELFAELSTKIDAARIQEAAGIRFDDLKMLITYSVNAVEWCKLELAKEHEDKSNEELLTLLNNLIDAVNDYGGELNNSRHHALGVLQDLLPDDMKNDIIVGEDISSLYGPAVELRAKLIKNSVTAYKSILTNLANFNFEEMSPEVLNEHVLMLQAIVNMNDVDSLRSLDTEDGTELYKGIFVGASQLLDDQDVSQVSAVAQEQLQRVISLRAARLIANTIEGYRDDFSLDEKQEVYNEVKVGVVDKEHADHVLPELLRLQNCDGQVMGDFSRHADPFAIVPLQPEWFGAVLPEHYYLIDDAAQGKSDQINHYCQESANAVDAICDAIQAISSDEFNDDDFDSLLEIAGLKTADQMRAVSDSFRFSNEIDASGAAAVLIPGENVEEIIESAKEKLNDLVLQRCKTLILTAFSGAGNDKDELIRLQESLNAVISANDRDGYFNALAIFDIREAGVNQLTDDSLVQIRGLAAELVEGINERLRLSEEVVDTVVASFNHRFDPEGYNSLAMVESLIEEYREHALIDSRDEVVAQFGLLENFIIIDNLLENEDVSRIPEAADPIAKGLEHMLLRSNRAFGTIQDGIEQFADKENLSFADKVAVLKQLYEIEDVVGLVGFDIDLLNEAEFLIHDHDEVYQPIHNAISFQLSYCVACNIEDAIRGISVAELLEGDEVVLNNVIIELGALFVSKGELMRNIYGADIDSDIDPLKGLKDDFVFLKEDDDVAIVSRAAGDKLAAIKLARAFNKNPEKAAKDLQGCDGDTLDSYLRSVNDGSFDGQDKLIEQIYLAAARRLYFMTINNACDTLQNLDLSSGLIGMLQNDSTYALRCDLNSPVVDQNDVIEVKRALARFLVIKDPEYSKQEEFDPNISAKDVRSILSRLGNRAENGGYDDIQDVYAEMYEAYCANLYLIHDDPQGVPAEIAKKEAKIKSLEDAMDGILQHRAHVDNDEDRKHLLELFLHFERLLIEVRGVKQQKEKLRYYLDNEPQNVTSESEYAKWLKLALGEKNPELLAHSDLDDFSASRIMDFKSGWLLYPPTERLEHEANSKNLDKFRSETTFFSERMQDSRAYELRVHSLPEVPENPNFDLIMDKFEDQIDANALANMLDYLPLADKYLSSILAHKGSSPIAIQQVKNPLLAQAVHVLIEIHGLESDVYLHQSVEAKFKDQLQNCDDLIAAQKTLIGADGAGLNDPAVIKLTHQAEVVYLDSVNKKLSSSPDDAKYDDHHALGRDEVSTRFIKPG